VVLHRDHPDARPHGAALLSGDFADRLRSSTYFPLPDVPWLHAVEQVNPLHHLAEGLRRLLLEGTPTWHLAAVPAPRAVMLLLLMPLDLRLLRKRVFGDA